MYKRQIRYCYDYKEPGDEAAEITSGLSEDQLILLAVGDPGSGQGSNLGAAGISVPGSAGAVSYTHLDVYKRQTMQN